MVGTFLTYFIRQALLYSHHGKALMDLLQDDYNPKSYVILDDDLVGLRVTNRLRMPTSEGAKLAPLFMEAFEQVARGQVFRDKSAFVDHIVEPRLLAVLRGSREVLSAFSATEAEYIRFDPDTWEDTDDLYRGLLHAVPMDREDLVELRKLRDVKNDTWTYRQMFQMYATAAAGNVLNYKFTTWCTVQVEFAKLDRAILAAGEYDANVYGSVAYA